MTTIKIELDWFANTNHTGLLLAKKLGWFEEAGLDVEIDGKVHGAMDVSGVDMVLGPQISMLECISKGIGMTAIATLTQKCDSGLVSLKKSGITSPKKLEGKRLTHWTPKWFHAVIGEAVSLDGGDYSKVNLVPMDVGDIVTTLRTEADATWVYENWENQELLEAGEEINYISLADFNPLFDFCAPCIAATTEFIKNNPEALRKFLKVLDRAYRQTALNPEESVLAVREMLPQVSDSLLVRSQKHLATILLDEKGRWGRIADKRWNMMADFLVEKGITDRRYENEFTNEFFED